MLASPPEPRPAAAVTPGQTSEADLPPEIAELRARIGRGLEQLDGLPEGDARDAFYSLLEAIDALHRDSLGHMLTLIGKLAGPSLVDELGADPVTHSLLELYDLLPRIDADLGDAEAQVEAALLEVYPYMESHGGRLEVRAIQGGQVHVRLSGSCEDCPGSSVTLRRVVEAALREHIAWFKELVVEEQDPAPAPVPLPEPAVVARVPVAGERRALRRPRWVSVARLDDLRDGELRTVRPEGSTLLIVRLNGEAYAYADGCPPESMLTLKLGVVEGVEIVCPWHGCRYDGRTGRRTDGDGRLAVYPVAVQGGDVRVALGTQEVQPG